MTRVDMVCDTAWLRSARLLDCSREGGQRSRHDSWVLPAMSARVSITAAAIAAPVRTLFQAVQWGMYRAHCVAPWALSGLTAANVLFNGTLQTIVTRTVPTR